jgi:hypothetical protein
MATVNTAPIINAIRISLVYELYFLRIILENEFVLYLITWLSMNISIIMFIIFNIANAINTLSIGYGPNLF